MKWMAFPAPQNQRGAAAVEFALVAIVFFMLLIGIVEMGRVLFTWNAMVEATRYGARVAVVCPKDDPAILSRMQLIMPALTAANVSVSYVPSGCTVANCQQVSVSIQNVPVSTLIPVSAATIMVPPFTTTLPRESMLDSMEDADGVAHPNPVCS